MQQSVEEFHEKHGFPVGIPLEESGRDASVDMLETAHALEELAEKLEDQYKHGGDVRALRAHLIVEEVSEIVKALANEDRLELLDGIADALYVVLGCAVVYGLPAEEAFRRVHASNMTKGVNGSARLRDKGADYQPPVLEDLV